MIGWQSNIQRSHSRKSTRDGTHLSTSFPQRQRLCAQTTTVPFSVLYQRHRRISATRRGNLSNIDGSVPSLSDQHYAQWWEMMASQKWCIGQRAHHATRHGLITSRHHRSEHHFGVVTPRNLRDSGSVFYSTFLPFLPFASLTSLLSFSSPLDVREKVGGSNATASARSS